MRVIVHLGEPFWRTAGRREVEVSLTEGATVADAFSALKQLHPALAAELENGEAQPALFFNDEEARPNTRLVDGAKLYIIWPVSGG
jgi:molybdopterin converting factor small subunit